MPASYKKRDFEHLELYQPTMRGLLGTPEQTAGIYSDIQIFSCSIQRMIPSIPCSISELLDHNSSIQDTAHHLPHSHFFIFCTTLLLKMLTNVSFPFVVFCLCHSL